MIKLKDFKKVAIINTNNLRGGRLFHTTLDGVVSSDRRDSTTGTFYTPDGNGGWVADQQ